MRELSHEERERMKLVLHTDDAGLDEWLETQERETTKPQIELDTYEAQALAHQTKLMQACLRAADEILEVPSGRPDWPSGLFHQLMVQVGIEIHRGVTGEMRDSKDSRDV
jgi:hypothetical protein